MGRKSDVKSGPCRQLITALRANIADPSNLTWRAVLEALAAVEAEATEQGDDRD